MAGLPVSGPVAWLFRWSVRWVQGGPVATGADPAGSGAGAGWGGRILDGKKSGGRIVSQRSMRSRLSWAILSQSAPFSRRTLSPPQRILGEDAEGEADLGQDLTDRAIAELGGDFLRCGKGDGGVGVARLGRGAGAGLALGGRGLGGLFPLMFPLIFPLGPGERGVEGGGEAQAARDAGENEGDVLGGETHGDPEDGHAGGPAVRSQVRCSAWAMSLRRMWRRRRGAGGRVRLILVGIGRLGERGGAGRGGHGAL